MTVQQRVLMARMMNQMEEMYKHGSDQVKKDSDGSYHYYNSNGEEIISAKMKGAK